VGDSRWAMERSFASIFWLGMFTCIKYFLQLIVKKAGGNGTIFCVHFLVTTSVRGEGFTQIQH
jgi:hypothetical protein